MIVTYENYQIRPYNNGLCWQLYELKTVHKGKEDEREKWVELEIYPSTFEYAVFLVYERCLKKSQKKADIREAIAEAKRIRDELLEAITNA